jgi:hypothetical protein
MGDLDGSEIRTRLRTLRLDWLPFRYLEGDQIPRRYKVRSVEGEAVPINVLTAMEQNMAEAWNVRHRMFAATAESEDGRACFLSGERYTFGEVTSRPATKTSPNAPKAPQDFVLHSALSACPPDAP